MPRRLRLDAELVRRGLARSREHAGELISAKRVKVAGAVATKAATGVTTDVALVVLEDPDRPDYVSRGGHKLAGALAAFEPLGLSVVGRRCLDAGASTGGFTDVLLRHGAAEVVAVDVGYGQLAWSLQQDPRVHVHDRTNVRELTSDQIGGPVDVVVGDLSFISLLLVLDALLGVTKPDGDLALMVKPQFEVGKDRVGKGGVVRDPVLRAEAVSSRVQCRRPGILRGHPRSGRALGGLGSRPLPRGGSRRALRPLRPNHLLLSGRLALSHENWDNGQTHSKVSWSHAPDFCPRTAAT